MTLSYRGRLVLLAFLAGALGTVLTVRLFSMQVLAAGTFERAAEKQIASDRSITPPRGRILDAKGRELAVDEVGYELGVRAAAWRAVMHECPNCGFVRFYPEGEPPGKCVRCRTPMVRVGRTDLAPLARLLGTSAAELRERIEGRVKAVEDRVDRVLSKEGLPPRPKTEEERQRQGRTERQESARLWGDLGWRARRIARDVPYEVAREIELNPYRNPALRIEPIRTRRATGGRDFVHILGHVIQKPIEIPHRPDVEIAIGVSGIEAAFDRQLRGEPGYIRIARDPRDGDEQVVERIPARPGVDVRLTIASEDQARAVAALGSVSGALVVIEAETGRVIAAASSPGYEPEEYAEVLKRLDEERKRRDGKWPKHHALLDAAFSDFDLPGSIVKPITAVAALTTGVTTPDLVIPCDRYFRNRRGYPLRNLRCSSAHGDTTLHEAIVHSCNVYFQTVQKEAIERGLFDQMFGVARRFGFGLPTGIELEPDPFPDTYEPGTSWAENVWMAIGQGKVRLSPAQVARAYAGIATGSLPRLHLVAEVGGQAVAPERTPLGIDEGILRQVREALVEVPRRGTAAGHGLERWPLSVKTGTAQLGSNGLQNAWLAGYLPPFRGRPAVAFALVVFDTEENGAAACADRLAEFLRGFYAEGEQ
jgi:cell division protein FtsI/penicillin-binding protein 2